MAPEPPLAPPFAQIPFQLIFPPITQATEQIEQEKKKSRSKWAVSKMYMQPAAKRGENRVAFSVPHGEEPRF